MMTPARILAGLGLVVAGLAVPLNSALAIAMAPSIGPARTPELPPSVREGCRPGIAGETWVYRGRTIQCQNRDGRWGWVYL